MSLSVRIPASAAPDVQAAFLDVKRALDAFTGGGNIDLNQRRIINAGPSIGNSDYVTSSDVSQSIDRAISSLRIQLTAASESSDDLIVKGRLAVGQATLTGLAQATVTSATQTQFALLYDINNLVTFAVSSVGGLAITGTGTNGNFILTPAGTGKVGIGTTPAAQLHVLATTEQLRLGFDSSKRASFTVSSIGSLTVAVTGTNPNITLTPSGTGNTYVSAGAVGIAVALGSIAAKLHVLATTEQLRLAYDGSNYTSFTTASAGTFTLAPTGTNPSIILTPAGTGGVGIGLTSPLAKLHVRNPGNGVWIEYDASNQARFDVNSTGDCNVSLVGTNPKFRITPTGTGYVEIAGTASAEALRITGFPKFAGTNSTGAGSALLGANSPASTLTAPYTWVACLAGDGTPCSFPIWK